MNFPDFFHQQLGLSVPVIQAPMAGGGDTPELVAAVSNAGGLGFLGAPYLTPQQIVEGGAAVRRLTSRPFGINLFAPLPAPESNPSLIDKARRDISPYYRELDLPEPPPPSLKPHSFEDQFAACLESGAAAFSFTFGPIPSSSIAQAKQRRLVVIGTATTVHEAQLLKDAGVDAIIAQGSEAGGHRGTFSGSFHAGSVGLFSLLPQVADAVRIPVVASGGVMDGRGIVAALALGAGAVQMGTAFLPCPESGIPECYKAAILHASEDDTRITTAFSGRPARGIANRLLREYESEDRAILPFPLQNALTRPLRTRAAAAGQSEYLSLWCGQSPRLARRLPATELVRTLAAEIAETLARLPWQSLQ